MFEETARQECRDIEIELEMEQTTLSTLLFPLTALGLDKGLVFCTVYRRLCSTAISLTSIFFPILQIVPKDARTRIQIVIIYSVFIGIQNFYLELTDIVLHLKPGWSIMRPGAVKTTSDRKNL